VEMEAPPLANATTLEEIRNFPWPDNDLPSRNGSNT